MSSRVVNRKQEHGDVEQACLQHFSLEVFNICVFNTNEGVRHEGCQEEKRKLLKAARRD